MNRKHLFLIVTIAFCITILFSCKKDPGEGGTSSLFGKVYAKDYNSTFTVLQGEYYVPDKWVFIVYGDEKDYGNRIRTNYDGTYEFKYLRPGTYHIYVYSKDSTLQTNASVAVLKDVTISSQNTETRVPDLNIFTVNGKN
ncbi:MAG: hypothetical protein WCL00_08285 [Bacteroidota bacterium]